MNTPTPDKEKEIKRRTGGEDIPPKEAGEKPDFARGMHDEPLPDETPDYARGQRKPGERAEPEDDYAKGVREGKKDRTVHPDYSREEEDDA